MKIERNVVLAEPSPVAVSKAFRLGFALQIIKRSRHHRCLPTAQLFDVVEAALAHNQVRFYFSEEGNPVGYVVWASLADDVEARFVEEKSIFLHASEWNEGTSVWLLDFVAQPQYLRSIVSDLRRVFFRRLQRLRYIRRTARSAVLCEIQRAGEEAALHLTKVVV